MSPAGNTLVFEQGPLAVVDSEVATPAGSWTLTYLTVQRIGNLVVMHMEATGGTGTIFTLPPDFVPDAAVTDGAVTVSTAGVVAAAASPGRTTLAWAAGNPSP